MKNCVQNASMIKSDFIFDVWLLRTFKPSLSSFLSDKKSKVLLPLEGDSNQKNPPIIFNYQKVPKPVSSCSQAILDLLGISALLSPENHSVNNNHHYLRPLTPLFFLISSWCVPGIFRLDAQTKFPWGPFFFTYGPWLQLALRVECLDNHHHHWDSHCICRVLVHLCYRFNQSKSEVSITNWLLGKEVWDSGPYVMCLSSYLFVLD